MFTIPIHYIIGKLKIAWSKKKIKAHAWETTLHVAPATHSCGAHVRVVAPATGPIVAPTTHNKSGADHYTSLHTQAVYFGPFKSHLL